MNASKRKTIIAALTYGAALSSAFVNIAPSKVHNNVVNDNGLVNVRKDGFKVPRLYFWQKKDDPSVDTTTLDETESAAFSWLNFPEPPQVIKTTPTLLVDNDTVGDESDGTNGRLGMVVAARTQELLSPAARALDDATDGWALGYADLSPETEETPVGVAFLATNIAYALAGVLMSLHGEITLGFLTECASVASFVYHFTQLQAPTNRNGTQDSTVRLALMVDYVFALSSMALATLYLIFDHTLPPMEATISGAAGLGCLFACWIWEQGLIYIALHSLWHLFSAYCGYIIGVTHISGA